MPDSIKDELVAAQQASTGSTGSSESVTSSMPAYADPQRAAAINDLYDKNIAAQRANLQTSYDQNLSNYEANRESIAKRYTQARNTAATDYERQRRNFNEQAMMNGIGTGVGSQAALAQNAAYQRQQGAINAAEGTDVSTLNRNIADLKVRYQNDINSAIAENDYKRAAALLDEYNLSYQRAQQEAQTKASYGDFSGYANVFGQETADMMQSVWARQNPGIAYSLGYIDAATYRTITGKYPPGYSAGGGGGGGRSGGGSTPPGGPDLDKLREAELARINGDISQVVGDANARADAMSEALRQQRLSQVDQAINDANRRADEISGALLQRTPTNPDLSGQADLEFQQRQRSRTTNRDFDYTNYITNYNVQ